MTTACANATPKKERKHVKRLPPPGLDVMLTTDEAAAELGLGVSTFWRKVKNGQLPPAVYLFPKVPRWRRGGLYEYVAAAKAAAA